MKKPMVETKHNYIVNMALMMTNYYKRLHPLQGQMQQQVVEQTCRMLYTALYEAGYTPDDFKNIKKRIDAKMKQYEADLAVKKECIEAFKNQ